jgi:hypothetical protein
MGDLIELGTGSGGFGVLSAVISLGALGIYALTQGNGENDDDDSVKYHSLTTAELEYDDLNEDQVQVEPAQPVTNPSSIQTKQIKDCITYELNNVTHTVQNCAVPQKYAPQVDTSNYRADSTHFSITNYQLVNDYEETSSLTHPNSKLKEESSLIDRHEISPKSLNQCLLNLQSRSRLPISIKSNLNLPTLQWLGLKLTDLDNLFIKKKSEFMLKLNVHDKRIASSLIKKLNELEEYELVNEVYLILVY